MAPLFSIITVTYNASDVIDITLRSIAEQTCRLYEVIVQDGGSTDETVSEINASGLENLSIVSAPDNGIYDAMNRALSRATGDYVIFLNAGDRFHSPDTLQLIADTVMDEDYPGVVYGQTDIVDLDGRFLRPRHLRAPEVLTVDSFKQGMVVCHQAFIVLRKLTEPFDTRYRLSADFDWCIKCLMRSRRNHYIPAVIIDYLAGGMSVKHRRRSLMERFRIMCRYYGTIPTLWRHLSFARRFTSQRRRGLQ